MKEGRRLSLKWRVRSLLRREEERPGQRMEGFDCNCCVVGKKEPLMSFSAGSVRMKILV